MTFVPAMTQEQLVALRHEIEQLREQLEVKHQLMHDQRVNCAHAWDNKTSALNSTGTCQVCFQHPGRPPSRHRRSLFP